MSRIFDSSHLTQRKAEKAIAGSFLSLGGSKPMLGIKDSSILYAVKSGSMTQYSRLPTCIEVSPGCPCAPLNAAPFNPALLPGLVSGITFTVGSILVSWVAPILGPGPFTYTVTPYLHGAALPSVLTTSTSYRFTHLQEMQPYTFTVTAINAFGPGAAVSTPLFVAPPSDLPVILSGAPIPPVDVSPSLLYIINAGLDYVMNYAQGLNVGPTIISRIMYLWVASIVQAWNWITADSHVSGIHDQWNWDSKAAVPLSDCDAILFICSVVDHVTPLIVPGPYVSIYNCSAEAIARVQAAGQWSAWLLRWQTWLTSRQADGAAAAITTLPTGSANWAETIIVDGVTVNAIMEFPQPQQWTRLTVQGRKQGYLTYTWDNVASTCLLAQDEMDIQASVVPATGADRNAEIDSVLVMTAALTDVQKIQAEFWAGSAVGSISPPLMTVWLWKEYMRAVGVNCSTLLYSLLDLSIHMFEAGRVTWGIKALYMQDRPIQEIRRRYAGQQVASWSSATVDGAQWVPYQRANFVTPPFPDFTSGHSCFAKCFALTMTKWFGSTITKNVVSYDNLQWMAPLFPSMASTMQQPYGDFVILAGSSLVQPGVVPAAPVTLSFQTWDDVALSAGMSRLYGGIHTMTAHTGAQTVAVLVDGYVNSTWSIRTFS